MASYFELFLPLVLTCFAGAWAQAQKSTLANELVDYRPGSINLIITIPHGGNLNPLTIRDRTAGCYIAASKTCIYRHNCTQNSAKCPVIVDPDNNLFKVGERVRTLIYEITGRYPYWIANKLHRNKLDANREVEEAAFGEPPAVDAWNAYHGAAQAARDEIQRSGNYTGVLLIDLHGQSHSHNLTELGYNLTASELDSRSYSLQATSTVRFAASRVKNSQSIITGDESLGYFLEKQSIKCLPSPSNPTINERDYFNGGYTAQTYSSATSDAILVELSRTMRFGTPAEFEANMQKLARGLVEYLRRHYPQSAASSLQVSSITLLSLLLSLTCIFFKF